LTFPHKFNGSFLKAKPNYNCIQCNYYGQFYCGSWRS